MPTRPFHDDASFLRRCLSRCDFRTLRLAVVTAMAGLALSGCATINGAQDAPAGFKSPKKMVSFDEALKAYNQPETDNSPRLGMTRTGYRAYIIDLYMVDTENKYRRFKQQLNSADRGSALAGDLVLLGLTGATALAGAGAIDELATITAVATGTRAAVDKRLFFDRTMPAVIAAMDARRATIQAQIETRRRLPEEQYPLDQALRDIGRLIAAGNITDAIGQITAQATADKAAAEARLAKIVEGCSAATEQTAALSFELRTFLTEDAAHKDARIAAAAQALSAKPEEGDAITLRDIGTALDAKYCNDDDGRRAFITDFKAKTAAAEGGE